MPEGSVEHRFPFVSLVDPEIELCEDTGLVERTKSSINRSRGYFFLTDLVKTRVIEARPHGPSFFSQLSIS